MPVNFQNIINHCTKLGYTIPGQNGFPNARFAGVTVLPNCYFGEYDTNTSCFSSVVCSTIDRLKQSNPVIVIFRKVLIKMSIIIAKVSLLQNFL